MAPQDQESQRGQASTDVAVERRRVILRGLGKTAAIAGAAVPLKSLAVGQKMKVRKSDGAFYVCSVSGQMSLLVSVSVNAVPQCLGSSADAFAREVSWPDTGVVGGATVKGCNFGAQFRACTDTFQTCFGSGSNATIISLIQQLAKNPAGAPDEAWWVLAVLSARVNTATYPYTVEEVVAQYKDTANQAEALLLHKTIAMQ